MMAQGSIWQGRYADTDAGHCPECGGECDELDKEEPNG